MAQEHTLKRQVGLFGSITILVGAVIGSGIFVTPGTVALAAGSFGPFMLAWVIAGISGILCALVYAELAPAIPEAGGPYAYIRRAYGKPLGFAYGWAMTVGSQIPLVAMLGIAFANNFAKLLPGVDEIGIKLIATAVITGLLAFNICGVKFGSMITNIFTIGKLAALILVIIGGFVIMAPEHFTSTVATAGASEGTNWGGAWAAAFPAFLAFGGYYQLAYMGGEVKDPKKNIPLAMVLGMIVVIVINILLAVACVGAVGYGEIAGSETPVIDAGIAIFGPVGGTIITIGACLSIFGALNGCILSYPRVTYGMARDNMMFKSFAKVSKFDTPAIATLFIGILALMFVWSGTFSFLLSINVFAGRVLECVICSSLLVLRKKEPNLERPLKMPGYPITTILAIGITLFVCAQVAPDKILWGLGLIATSIPAYFFFKFLDRSSNKDS